MNQPDYTKPMNALRLLRMTAKPILKKLMSTDKVITPNELEEFAGSIMIVNSVPGIDDQPPLPYPDGQ